MNHHRTYHLFPDGRIQTKTEKPLVEWNYANPGQSYFVRFCQHTLHNTCAQVDLLSRAFADAQLFKDDNPEQETFYISVIVHEAALAKFKPQDHQTSMDRIEWLIREFQPPTLKLVISIYVCDTMTHVESGFFTSTLWPFRRRWDRHLVEKHISIQVSEGSGASWKKENTTALIEMTEELCAMYGYASVRIDYTYNYEDAFQLILKSRLHVGYVGASHFLALAAGIPTVGYGVPYREIEYEGRMIGQSIMGTAQTGPLSMRQRDPATLKVEERPITTTYNTTSPLDVLHEFYRIENIVATKRDS